MKILMKNFFNLYFLQIINKKYINSFNLDYFFNTAIKQLTILYI